MGILYRSFHYFGSYRMQIFFGERDQEASVCRDWALATQQQVQRSTGNSSLARRMSDAVSWSALTSLDLRVLRGGL